MPIALNTVELGTAFNTVIVPTSWTWHHSAVGGCGAAGFRLFERGNSRSQVLDIPQVVIRTLCGFARLNIAVTGTPSTLIHVPRSFHSPLGGGVDTNVRPTVAGPPNQGWQHGPVGGLWLAPT